MPTTSGTRKTMALSAAASAASAVLGLFLVVSTTTPCAVSAAPGGAKGIGKGRAQLVSVSAPWPTSCLSPLAEASEFVAEGSSTAGGGGLLFWDFVEALGDAPHRIFSCRSELAAATGATATAGSGEERNGADAAGPPEGVVEAMEDEGAASVVAAVRAAGEGFGDADDGGDAGAPGVGLDELSLRLMEVALSARYHYVQHLCV